MPRRPHLVSAGYQRRFVDGEQVLLIDKAKRTATKVSVRDAFVRRGFTIVRTDKGPSDWIEDEWAKIEGRILPALKPLLEEGHTPEAEHAAKVLMALHWSRASAIKVVHDRIIEAETERHAKEMPQDPAVLAVFRKDAERDPLEGEIDAVVREAMAAIDYSRQEFVHAMARFYGKALEYFERFHLQVAKVLPRKVGLLYGDNPVVLQQGIRVGPQAGVGLMSADVVYMPLTRWVALSLTTEPGLHGILAPRDVQRLNNLMWRSCVDHLAAHPEEDWRTALQAAL
jgi:hypothetical protein